MHREWVLLETWHPTSYIWDSSTGPTSVSLAFRLFFFFSQRINNTKSKTFAPACCNGKNRFYWEHWDAALLPNTTPTHAGASGAPQRTWKHPAGGLQTLSGTLLTLQPHRSCRSCVRDTRISHRTSGDAPGRAEPTLGGRCALLALKEAQSCFLPFLRQVPNPSHGEKQCFTRG